MLGSGLWMCLKMLGVPNVFHVGDMIGLIPLGVAGAAIACTKFRRSMIAAFAIPFLALIVIAYTPVIVAPARALIRSDALPPSADAVVVLSAGITPDGFLQQQGLDRLLTGMRIVREGIAPRLIVTREQRHLGARAVTSAGDQSSLASLAGIDVISTPVVKSTRDEALAVAQVASIGGWKSIVLVTSPFHTSRACAVFERVGFHVTCVPSESRDIAIRSLDVPEDRIGAFAMWIYEMAGRMQYSHKGWM